MLTNKSFLSGAVLAAALAGPLAAQQAPATADPETVVARVGDEVITLGHMIVVRQVLPPRFAQYPDAVLFPEILEQLIQQTALSQSVGELSEGTRLRLENERRALIASEQVEAFAEVEIAEEEVQAAYDARYADYTPDPEYNASHILVETEEEARAILAELEAGAEFAALAQERSIGPSSVNGGSLGWFGPGQMVAEFEAAVVALEPGQVSEPVQTQFGWHVVILNDKRVSSVPGLEEVRGNLVTELQQDRIRASIAAVIDATEIERPDLEGIDPSVLSNPDLIE